MVLRLIRLGVLLALLRLVTEVALGALVSWIARLATLLLRARLLATLLLAARLIRRGLLPIRLIRRRLLGVCWLAALLTRLTLLTLLTWLSVLSPASLPTGLAAGLPGRLPTGLVGGGLLGGGAASVRGSVHRVLRVSRRNVGASLGGCDGWTDTGRAVGLGGEGARNLRTGSAVASGRGAAASLGGGTAVLIRRWARILVVRSGAAGHLIRILGVVVLVHRSSFRVSAVVSPLSEMGRSMRNVAPPPGVSWTEIAPWWFSTIALTIDSPRPDPPVSLVRDTSRR